MIQHRRADDGCAGHVGRDCQPFCQHGSGDGSRRDLRGGYERRPYRDHVRHQQGYIHELRPFVIKDWIAGATIVYEKNPTTSLLTRSGSTALTNAPWAMLRRGCRCSSTASSTMSRWAARSICSTKKTRASSKATRRVCGTSASIWETRKTPFVQHQLPQSFVLRHRP